MHGHLNVKPKFMSPRWDSNLQFKQTQTLHHAVTVIGTIYGMYVKEIRCNILKYSAETSVWANKILNF